MKQHYLSLICLAMLVGQLAFGQNWQAKLDPTVFQAAAKGESVDCIVVMAERADLSEAAFLIGKEKKGEYVFRQLTEVAARTQSKVVLLAQQHGSPYRPYFIVNIVRLEKANLALLEAIAKLPEVRRIDPNPHARFQEPRVDQSEGGSRAIEWNVTLINADDAWTLGYDGSGITVAGQDTGYDWDHPALLDKYRGWNGSSADHNHNWHDAIHGLDPHNSGTNPCGYDSPVPCDDNNHGTHTMGTMVGDDGAGNQIGVAPGATWISCRNMERNWGMPTTYIECFEWFLAPTDLSNSNPTPSLAPHVINNSWGCPPEEGCNSGNFSVMNEAVMNLYEAGVVVVASAGNSGPNCSTVDDPAAMYDSTFSVGATNSANDIANFSSRGPVTIDGSNRMKPNVCAPGVNIRSSVNGGTYQGGWNGTSMAGPHVAATVALMLNANPNLTVTQIRTILQNTTLQRTSAQNCTAPGSQVPNNTYGWGVIDAMEAVNESLSLFPVELTGFQGEIKQNGILLNWNIASGGSLNHFELEWADSRLNWSVIGKHVFLPEKTNYEQLDPGPVPGINYYRLKMVDIDGSVEYSKIIAIRWDGNGTIAISPNPVFDMLTVGASWQLGEVEATIFDASGKLAQTSSLLVNAPNETLQLGVATLPPGIYFIKIVTENGAGLLLQSKFCKR